MEQIENHKVTEITDISTIFYLHISKFASVFILVMMISIVVAFTLPQIYRSTTNILIEGQEIPLTIVKTTVSGFVDARLEAVEQRVKTSENLMAIIRKYGLYKNMSNEQNGKVLQLMRDSITREMSNVDAVNPRNGRPIVATVSFLLSFDADDPQIAQNVANELAQLFLLENANSRTEQAEKVSVFLAEEAEKLNTQIVDIEYKLAEFKQKNVSSLPEHADINRRLLESAEGELVRIDYRINSLEERKRGIESRIEVKAFESGAYTGSGEKILTVNQMLRLQRARLAESRTRYSDIHPDVINLKREIAALEDQRANPDLSLADELLQNDAPSSLIDITRKTELDEITAEIIAEKNTREKLIQKFQGYEQRLFRTPVVERDYQILARDRENALNSYRDIKDRQMEAEMAEQLERDNKAERLTIIEPASFPTELQSPNRPGILFLGFVLAMGLGVGFVTLADHFDNTIHGARGVAAVINTPPLATIPLMTGVVSDTKRMNWYAVSLLASTLFILIVFQVYWEGIASTLLQFLG